MMRKTVSRWLVVWLCVLSVGFGGYGWSVLPSPATVSAEEAAVDALLAVDAGTAVAPMKETMRGTNIGLWTIGEFYPTSKRSERYVNLIKEAGIKLIRFPAGAEADTIYWDRTNTYKWYQGPSPYIKTLTADMLDSYMDLLEEVDAEALVTVNAKINDSAMAADLVRYANIEKGYNIKYWEIGNEPEYYNGAYDITPEQFAVRIEEYAAAMKAVDPSITIVGPASGGITGLMTGWVKPILSKLHDDGKPVDAISVHWYPLAGNQTNPASSAYPSIENLLKFEGTDWQPSYINWVDKMTETDPVDNLLNYRSLYAPNALIGLTEVGQVTSNGEGVADTLAGAVWMADVLPRFAYHHVDYVTQFLLEGNQTYSLFNEDLELRPIYYVYPLLTRYFGDQMVASSSSDNQNFTIWASKRTGEDGKLHVMVVNKNQTEELSASIDLTGFDPQSTASAWVLNGPSVDSLTGTNINGVQVAEDGTLADIAGVPIVGVSSSFTRTFPAHSVTVMELTAKPASPEPVRYLGQYADGVNERKTASDYPGNAAHTPQGFGKIWATGKGSWNVNFPAAGEYDFAIRAYGEGTQPSFRVEIDGEAVPNAAFTPGSSWQDYAGSLGTVTAGVHTVRIHNDSPAVGNNIDLAHMDIFGAAPGAFALQSPADQATVGATSILLDWTQSIAGHSFAPFGAEDYIVTVADNPQLTDPVIQMRVTETSYLAENLSYNTTYYWQVLANNANGWTASDAVFSFHVDGEGARYLGQYADGANERKTAADYPGNATDTPQGFGKIWATGKAGWDVNFPVAGDYNFTIRAYGEGAQPSFRVEVDGQAVPGAAFIPGSSWQEYQGVLGSITAGMHSIRIHNDSPAAGNNIDLAHMTIYGAAPGGFSLQSPADNGAEDLTTVMLNWTQEAEGRQYAPFGANAYTVIVADNGSLSNPVLETTVDETSLMVNDLQYSTTYYWQVTAYNANGSTISDAVYSFTTPPPPAAATAVRFLGQYAARANERHAPKDYPGSAANTPDGWGKIWATGVGEWTVNLPRTDTYTASIRAYGEGGAAAIEVKVDGAVIPDSARSLTNQWVNYEVELGSISAGTHVITIRNTSSVAGNNVDLAHMELPGAAPGHFSLMSPADGALADSNVTLDWTQVIGGKYFAPFGADDYRVIVADNEALLNPVADAIVTGTQHPLQGLQTDTTYYWRVVARNANGWTPSDSVFRFTTAESIQDAAPARYPAQYADAINERHAPADYPGNAANTPDGWGKIWATGSGKWTVSFPESGIYRAVIRTLGEGAASYELKIDGTVVGGSSRNPAVMEWTDQEVGLGIVAAGTHTVEIHNNSPAVGLNVDVAHLDIIGAAPAPFDLVSPEDGEVLDSATAALDWTQEVGGRTFAPFAADDYTIVLADNAELSNPVMETTVTASTYQTGQLQYNTTYYWKVIANNANGSTPSGSVFSFVTPDAPVVVDADPPEFQLHAGGAELGDGGTFEDHLQLAFKVWDEQSGVASASISIDGINHVVDPASAEGVTIDLAGHTGLHVATITAVDGVGNVLEYTVTFTVTTSIDAIRTLLDRYAAADTKQVLWNHLDQAQHKLEMGRPEQAARHMGSFVKQLSQPALAGGMAAEHRAILEADGLALIGTWMNDQ